MFYYWKNKKYRKCPALPIGGDILQTAKSEQKQQNRRADQQSRLTMGVCLDKGTGLLFSLQRETLRKKSFFIIEKIKKYRKCLEPFRVEAHLCPNHQAGEIGQWNRRR